MKNSKQWNSKSKEYVKQYNAKYRAKMKSDRTALYYLPEHHYVGVTNSLRERLYRHNNQNRITEGVEIIAQFKSRKEALAAERLLHSIGYCGKNVNGLKNLKQFK